MTTTTNNPALSSSEYKAQAHALMGKIARGEFATQDELLAALQRMNTLSHLGGMAEVAERAMNCFVFEARVANL